MQCVWKCFDDGMQFNNFNLSKFSKISFGRTQLTRNSSLLESTKLWMCVFHFSLYTLQWQSSVYFLEEFNPLTKSTFATVLNQN